MSIQFTKPRRGVTRIFVHCSASDVPAHDNVSVMRQWHVEERGWSDVGYHFFIQKNGNLQIGRDIEITPAAQRGNNTGTIAICLHGRLKSKFTQAQYTTLKALCLEINKSYFERVSFHGHNEVANKSCPIFDYKEVLKLDQFGSLGLDNPPIMASATGEYPRLNVGAKGEDVRRLQTLLHIKVDGDYGSKTLVAVKSFKKDHDLYPSGIVTKQVWLLLSKPILENVVGVDVNKLPDLKQGSRGESVKYLQELLLLQADGIFGSNTARAVRAFKKDHKLYPSDIVQKHVWKLLLDVRKVEHFD